MMKTLYPISAYDSIEYGLLASDENAPKEKQQLLRNRNRRMSWGKCLCITLLVILAAFFVTSLTAALWGYFWMKNHVERFTTTEARHYDIHPISNGELDIVKDRAKLFYDTLKEGRTPDEDLVITQDHLNGFIAQSDFFRGNAEVHLTHNEMKVDMSLPAKDLPGGKGRYFVSSGSLTIDNHADDQDRTFITADMETPYPIKGMDYAKLLHGEFWAYVTSDGTQTLNIQEGQFYKWIVPDDFLAKNENLLDYVCDDDDKKDEDCHDFLAVLERIQDVTITDETITFHARPAASGGRRLKEQVAANKVSVAKSFYGRALAKMIF